MAYDEGLAQIMRDHLAARDDIVEKKMFGGIAFMLDGNMLCGVTSGGGMFRVGKENHTAALAIDGAAELSFTGRKMGGMVEADDDAIASDETRSALMGLALQFVTALPVK